MRARILKPDKDSATVAKDTLQQCSKTPDKQFPKSSIPPCRQWYSQSHVCVELSLKLTQKARYQHAVNNWHDLIVAWKFPWKSPKKLGTNMPSKTNRASSVSNGLPKPIEQRAKKKSHKRCHNRPVAQRVTQKKWKLKNTNPQCHSNKLERKFARAHLPTDKW